MLTATDRKLLDIASLAFAREEARGSMMAQDTGMSPTQCYQRLNVLAESEEALAYSPAVVKRLLRRREQRRRSRSARSSVSHP